MIRRSRRRRSRSEQRTVEAAFWVLLAFAVLVGGERAAAGLPGLLSMILPSGIVPAQADVQGPARRIDLPVRWHHPQSEFRPEVLTPVPSRGFPDWLVQRVRYAHLASGAPLAASAASRAPAIAIDIDDLGPDVAGTRAAIALPKAVTLAFLPYGNDTPALARAARRAGHQIIVHVPMQPDGPQDPGPMALRVDLSPARNIARLDWALSRVPGRVGLNNHMGSRFTSDRAALIPVMAHLAGKGLFFFDSRTTPNSYVIPLARQFGIMSAGRDVFLDDVQRPAYIAQQLAKTESIAREKGVAIAIGHPHPATLAALKTWTAQVTAAGYRLIPLSEAIRMKTEDRTMAIAEADDAQDARTPASTLPVREGRIAAAIRGGVPAAGRPVRD